MKRKFNLAILFLLVSILIVGAFPGVIFAEVSSEKNSVDAESFQVASINGDYEYTVINGGIEITGYNGAGGDVTIPKELGGNPIVSIAGGAFYDCSLITSVEIPDSVISIGDNAFSYCRNLTSINLPKSLTVIGECTFVDCKNLTSIDMPDNLTKIERLAFFNCNSLTAINFPDTLTSIESDAFSYCNALTSVIIPENVATVEKCAFFSCENLNSIQFNSLKTVVQIDDYFPTIPEITTIVGYDPSTAKDYADKNGNPFQPLRDESSKKNVTYTTHVQNYGWQDWAYDGDVSGTEGEGLRLEGIKIESGIDGVGVSYSTHVENVGWQNAVSDGKPSGTSGRGLRLEAITINLTGENACLYDVYYQVHAQNMGWLGLAKNGESAGTAGYGYRLEGIRILIVPTGSNAPNSTSSKINPYYENNMQKYQEIINEYRTASSDICDSERINNLSYVNKNIICKKLLLYYTLIDITGDGIEELIIANEPESNRDKKINSGIYDIYTIRKGKAERVIDNSDVGIVGGCSVSVPESNKLCKNYGHFKYIFKILSDGSLETTYSAYNKDGLFYMYYYEKGELKSKTITAEEYANLDNSKIECEFWVPLWK